MCPLLRKVSDTFLFLQDVGWSIHVHNILDQGLIAFNITKWEFEIHWSFSTFFWDIISRTHLVWHHIRWLLARNYLLQKKWNKFYNNPFHCTWVNFILSHSNHFNTFIVIIKSLVLISWLSVDMTYGTLLKRRQFDSLTVPYWLSSGTIPFTQFKLSVPLVL